VDYARPGGQHKLTDKTEIIQVDEHAVEVCYFDEGRTGRCRIWRIPLSEAADIADWWTKTGSHIEDFRSPSIEERSGGVLICVLSATQVYARRCDKLGRPAITGYQLPREAVHCLCKWFARSASGKNGLSLASQEIDADNTSQSGPSRVGVQPEENPNATISTPGPICRE